MGYSRVIRHLILLLLILCCGCDRKCHCPGGCTYCEDHWCDCCGTHAQSSIVRITLPEGVSAESFHLSIGNRAYDFCGYTKVVKCLPEPQDILVYNNDGETVIVDDKIASTHTSYDSGNIRYQPTPFYCLSVKDTLITGKDSVKLYLSPCVKSYRIHVRLKNNTGEAAVTACCDALVKGVASQLDLRSGERAGTTAHRLQLQMKDNEVIADFNTWGMTGTPVQIVCLFRHSYGQCKYIGDITELLENQPEGGNIYLSIDVERDLETLTTESGQDGFLVGTEEWNDHDTTIEI